MLDKNVVKLINEQITEEFYSAYLYLAFANHFDAEGLKGYANFFQVQTKEEEAHAMILRKYLLNNGEKPVLGAIKEPPHEFRDTLTILEEALKHEEYITSRIHKIALAATNAGDMRTVQFISWFVNEQAEEETNANDNITNFKLFGQDGRGLYMIDKDLQARVFNPPANMDM